MEDISVLKEKSFQPPDVAWQIVDGTVGFQALIDTDVVRLVAEGYIDFKIPAGKKLTRILYKSQSFYDQIAVAAWDRKLLRPPMKRLKAGSVVRVYLHGVFRLHGRNEVFVLVARSPATFSISGESGPAKAVAMRLWRDFCESRKGFDAIIDKKRKEHEHFHENWPQGEPYRHIGDAFITIEELWGGPVLPAEKLIPFLEKGFIFKPASKGRDVPSLRNIAKQLEAAPFPSPRDGRYEGFLGFSLGKTIGGLLTWRPYRGVPAYPEIRWAVQSRLPRALCNPRLEHLSAPKSSERPIDEDGAWPSSRVDIESAVLGEALHDLWVEPENIKDRRKEARETLRSGGFDALAWYQPWHLWNEDKWGIYVDAQKLDNLTLLLLDDLPAIAPSRTAHSWAARLALGLVVAHEKFHMTTEAASSWMELTSGSAKYLKYRKKVYEHLQGTSNWLEEALANWTSWAWAHRTLLASGALLQTGSISKSMHAVESLLDLAPAGYRDWRKGNSIATWRHFSNQLAQASAEFEPRPAPTESVVRGPYPYEISPDDVPLRFVGSGIVADRLQAHPAIFSCPSRRELEKALRYFQHTLNVSGGKGSHEKWTGPDRRAFPLPRRDPVSPPVFANFLRHVGIDKATYVREVRPKL